MRGRMSVPTLTTEMLFILSLFPFNQLVSCSESCWKNLTSWHGTFHSPSYSGNYSSNLDCYWLITVATGNTIAMTINDISVEPSPGCHKDFINVYDGPTKSSPIINTSLCGTSLSFQQRSIISSNNVILVRMHSDSESVSRGFNASYQGVCHVNITSPKGEISSPGFPGFYTNEAACNWLITRDGFYITIHISAVLPNSTDCRLNYIQIQEGRGSYSTILTICRRENTNITSKSPVRILYAKERNRMLAFKALYTMKDIDECSDRTLGGYPCHHNASCIDNNGSYACVCKEGYMGDGKNCSDIDECMALSPCHANADCINTNGSFICKCHKGYKGSGHYCQDINECMERTHSCRPGSICINKEGMYTCPCRDGFYFNRETAKCLSDVAIMNKPEESDKLLSPAVMAVIVTTVLLFLAIIVIGGLFYWKKYRSEDSHISEDQEMSKYSRNRTATMDSQSYDLCNISLSSMESGAKHSLGSVTTASNEHPARLNLEDVEDHCGDIVMTPRNRQEMTSRHFSRMQTFDGQLEAIEV